MNLIYYIMQRVSIFIVVTLSIWASIFYFTIVDEIEDETDDVLEDYAAMVIQNFLAGEELPQNNNGSNNSYYLRAIHDDSVAIAKRRAGFSNEDLYIKYKGEDEPARILRYVFRDSDDKYYEVTVSTPTIDKGDLISAILRSIIILFFLLTIIIILINTLAIKRGLSPLSKLLVWLNSSNIELASTPIQTDSKILEIKELNSAINRFASRAKVAFEQQKEFIGNASHELQTPIAICQNRLELLCESGLSEPQMRDVVECQKSLKRLINLNKTLLMLSKIDNGEFDSQCVDVNEIVKDNTVYFEEIYMWRDIHLTIHETDRCKITANSDLVSTMIINLIKNSYTHNVDGGEVDIQIFKDSIWISNSGECVALDGKKIFRRFYHNKTRVGSNGLGLSIVEAICKLYNFTVDYSFVDNKHTFKIFFGDKNN